MRSLNELRDEAYANAKAHGFHDVKRTVGDALMLITTEVGEAYEAFREGSKVAEVRYECRHPKGDCGGYGSPRCYPDDGTNECAHKPVGVASEIADIVIRVFDFCGEHEIDLERIVLEKMAYNKTRPFRHGNKAL